MSEDDIIKNIAICFDKKPEAAIEFLKSKGIAITWNWKEQLAAIENHCFTVAKVANADVLQMFSDELQSALDNGTPYQEFKKNITEVLDKKGYSKRSDGSAFRLDTIYRTNLQTAFMAGRYNLQKETADMFPIWQYVAVMDSRTRPAHAALNGTALRADDPFWETCSCPNGYNCRCRTKAMDEETAAKRGITVQDGKDVDFKPDEGFATNPSKQWEPDLTKYSPAIRNQLNRVL